jgi:hypothetical protein
MSTAGVQVGIVSLFALTCGMLAFASIRGHLVAGAAIVLVLASGVWVLAFAAIGSGYHDADGFATCGQDCSTVQYVSAIAFLAPPLLISLAALGMLYGLHYAIFVEHQTLDRMGASLAQAFTSAAVRDTVAGHGAIDAYASTKYDYVRQVDVHSHWIGLGMLLIVLGAAFVLVPASVWPSVALIVDELALELGLCQLKRARVNLRQEVAFLDQLAFLEADFEQLTADLGLHRYGRDRRHRAKGSHDDLDVAGSDGGHADRLRRGFLTTARISWRPKRPGDPVNAEPKQDGDAKKKDRP